MKIAIVGAGVSGLTCAAEIGRVAEVTIFHNLMPTETTSAVATAVWHVYLVDSTDMNVVRWAHRTLLRLCELIHEPYTGIELVRGVELFREGEPLEPVWSTSAIEFSMLHADEITRTYPGVKWGYRLTAPVANMTKYLPWLVTRCTNLGTQFCRRTITSLDEIADEFDFVVNCSGLYARSLTTDTELYGLRGQYLVLQAPEGFVPQEYVGDDQHPEGMAYMIPRDGELLIGGTEELTEELRFDISEQNLLERATMFCSPALREAIILRKMVGIRPCRRSGQIAFGRDRINPRLIHNYGHGGSGFSLSWGCAEAVRLELGLGSDTANIKG